MELEKLNLYRDTIWNDIKLRFCGHSECLPLHSYGPGTRPYYLMHFVLSGKGRLVVNKTEYLIEEKQIFLIEPDQMVFYQADKENPWTYSWVGSMANSLHTSFIVLDSVIRPSQKDFLQKSLRKSRISLRF